jgi:hypothetical protein
MTQRRINGLMTMAFFQKAGLVGGNNWLMIKGVAGA